MHHANIPKDIRYKVFPKLFETATLLDSLVVCTIDGVTKTQAEHFGNTISKFAKHLRTWGEAGTVTIWYKMQPKLEDRGITCVFVGYAVNHEGDCYLKWNPTRTMRVYTTRNIIWLNQFYFTKALQDADDEDLLQIVASDKVDDAVEGESGADAVRATAASRRPVTFADEQGATRRSTRIRFPKDKYDPGKWNRMSQRMMKSNRRKIKTKIKRKMNMMRVKCWHGYLKASGCGTHAC